MTKEFFYARLFSIVHFRRSTLAAQGHLDSARLTLKLLRQLDKLTSSVNLTSKTNLAQKLFNPFDRINLRMNSIIKTKNKSIYVIKS